MGKISEDIFDGNSSDSGTEIKTENQYAKNYDVWRKKEELNKLKTKYGEDVLEESSSSSDDDEDAVELTEEVEKDFFKTLSYLKKKDPKIYDSNVNFFKVQSSSQKQERKSKDQPMYLKDYERKLLLEKGGILSDEENEDFSGQSTTYAKEQENIKEEIVKLGANIDTDSEDEKLGGLLELRTKTKEENEKESAEYLKWLTGQMEEIEDNEIKSELKPLKDFWNDPNLDSGEKFLRDYVLEKRYLDKDNENHIPTYDEIIHDSDNSLSGDEEELEKQEEFEHKYNFRFEDPDQEFIKRYPRTIEQSLRKTDDKRKVKRAETKERKKKEKEEKMADIKKLQELKRKEIEEKIEKLKEVTGATDVPFKEDDVDGDFDPEAHDRRMQTLFNEEFYEGPENDQKPEFPDLDEELEIENWDRWNADENYQEDDYEQHEPHCEDDNFNMDADYDPSTSLKDELIENTKGKKRRKRKSKVAEALSRPKPKFDPNYKTYEKYLDEYYKLDCEDIIGDIPCRFKYREVIPNNFGLSVEEILMAKDKELNRWCSLKKAVQRRPDNVEKYDQIAYSKKANNIALKQRLLPSLFSEEAADEKVTIKPSTTSDDSIQIEPRNEENTERVDDNKEKVEATDKNSKKKKKSKKNKVVVAESGNQKIIIEGINKNNRKRKRIESEKNKQGNKKMKNKNSPEIGISDARLSAFGINPKKYKNKIKYGNKKNM